MTGGLEKLAHPGVALVAVRILAVAGTVLVGTVLAAPLVLLVVGLIVSAVPRLDYLLPGELVAVVAVGALVLLVAAYLGRRARISITVTAVLVGVFFGAVTWAATATGLATGAEPAEGWRLTLVLSAYVGYLMAAAALLVCGISLCRIAFRAARAPLARVETSS